MSSQPPSRESRADELDDGTVELIWDLIKEAPDQQLHTSEDLDDKMVRIFAAASVVVGLVSFSDKDLGTTMWIEILLIGLLLAYVVTAVAAFVHLRPREHWLALDASKVWSHGRDMAPAQIRRAAIEQAGDAYAHNTTILKDKARLITVAIGATAIEVLLVGLVLILPRLI